MKLTLYTDYSLRMLIFLALREGRSTTVSDIADAYGLSRNHLLKVALNLGRLGYVRTTRGRLGGIALAQLPEDINLGDVVRGTEDGFAMVECQRSDGGTCVISPACRLKGIVGKAVEAFLAVFDAYTLADIVANRTLLEALLETPSTAPRAA